MKCVSFEICFYKGKKINILHVTALNSKKYGSIEKWMVHLAKVCKDRKYKIIFSLRGEPTNKSFLNDLNNTGAMIDVTQRYLSGINHFCHIRNLIKKNRINIIHSHFSPVCHYANLAGYLSGIKGRFWTIHSMSEIDKHPYCRQRLIALKQQISSMLVHKMITVSKAIRDDFIRLGINSEKISVVPLGIDIEKYAFNGSRERLRRSFGISNDTLLIGTVSRAEPVKGLRYLVEAMPYVLERVPNAKVLLVGGGSLMQELKSIASNLNITGNIILEGIRDDVSDILSALDIFVLPSLSEGMPLALLEAMASGKPVVSSNVGGIPEVVEEGVNGYLVAPGDASQLAQAILKFALNPELSSTMSNAGRRKVELEYNLKHQAERLVDLYESQIQG